MNQYIDKKEAINALAKYNVYMCVDEVESRYHAEKALESVEIANVRENVCGKWVVRDKKVFCTHCNKPQFKYIDIGADWRPNFCPNCGADMRQLHNNMASEENDNAWKHKRKATEKQLSYIRHIERASCVPFYGETIAEADEYIKSHKRYLEKKRPDPCILTDIYDDIEQIYDPGMFC